MGGGLQADDIEAVHFADAVTGPHSGGPFDNEVILLDVRHLMRDAGTVEDLDELERIAARLVVRIRLLLARLRDFEIGSAGTPLHHRHVDAHLQALFTELTRREGVPIP